MRIPSRGGLDPYEPVLACMSAWLGQRGLDCRQLAGPDGETVALTCEVPGARPGPRVVLDACLDTAPFGDEAAWTYPPASGQITGGWLHGRGSSDSKAGAVIFAHLAARLADAAGGLAGSVVLLFDVDEHTGGFGGSKAYFENTEKKGPVHAVMIGYPGPGHVITGGRGVLRARVHVHAVAGHSGSARTGAGAIAKAPPDPAPPPGATAGAARARVPAARQTDHHRHQRRPGVLDGPGPVHGQRGHPAHTCPGGQRRRRAAAHDGSQIDEAWPGTPPTGMDITTRWPPYALPDGSPLRDALLQGAARAGLTPVAKIAGPSNIGNYLAGLGIPATAVRCGPPGPARHRRTHPPGLHTTHPSRLPLRAPHPPAQQLTHPSRKATAHA